MTWQIDFEQLEDKDGNKIPLWRVKQWNTTDENIEVPSSLTSIVVVPEVPPAVVNDALTPKI